MKNLIRFTFALGLFASIVFPAQAAFTSLYVLGDCISTTTNNTSGLPYYYGQRFSNGRVWVEVLAQQQGLTYNPLNNDSFFGNFSWILTTNLNNFAPKDARTSLVVVWVNNADLFYAASYDSANQAQWNAAITQSQNDHLNIIANLYAKGVRTLVMPNAVDISKIPSFDTDIYTNFISSMCVNYNAAFAATLNQARAKFPGLTIYSPDFYTLFMNLLTHPANYGVTNALLNGRSIDAADDPSLKYDPQTNGTGANYIFWDETDPTAKVHYWMASLAQQLISPVQISQLTTLNGSNRLDIVNVPVGQNGVVLGSTNLLSGWTTNTSFSSINTAQSVFVPAPAISTSTSSTNSPALAQMALSGPPGPPGPGGGSGSTNAVIVTAQFYKLNFPVVWTWP